MQIPKRERWATRLTVCLLLTSVNNPASVKSVRQSMYLLEDVPGQRWCAYRSQAAWKSAVDSLQALGVATVEYRNEHSSAVNFTQQDEAGDWIVYDRYSLGENGRLNQLRRKINIIPGDVSEEQVFEINDERANKISTVRRKLSTGKIDGNPRDVWLPDLPVITTLQAFPFSSLLNKRSAVLSKGKDCEPIPPQ